MALIQARPRWFDQVAFRSTLEADWANNLDHLNIAWRYEPKMFTLPNGDPYEPDFWLPDLGTWIEVKGWGVGREWKAIELAAMLVCHCQGRCGCEWFGGQIVLLGRPAMYGQFWAWSDALGVNTYLIQCASCGTWSWRRLRHSLRCRACRIMPSPEAWPLLSLRASGTLEFHRADRSDWTAVRLCHGSNSTTHSTPIPRSLRLETKPSAYSSAVARTAPGI